MSIEIAKYSGFCFGVARAVKLLDKALNDGKNVYCIGEMIHNPVFNKNACERGLKIIEESDINTLPKNSCVLIRSHGIAKDIEARLRSIGCEVIDATCPDVKKIHRIIDENTNSDTFLIMIGDEKHPEIIASVSYSRGKYLICKDFNDLYSKFNLGLISAEKDVIMVAQTTHSVSDYEISKNFIKKLYTNAEIFDTICNVTETRQREAELLSAKCDVMLVVGGKSSSNTLKLYDICKRNCEKTYFVESVEDVLCFEHELNIGIAAGASTPNGLIEEVANKCQKK